MRLIGIFLCFFCQPAVAAHLSRGDLEVQGGFSISNYSNPYSWGGSVRQTSFSLGSSAQYFFKDHFSAGIDLHGMKVGSRSLTWSLGPAVTRYFLVKERLAPFIFLSPIRISKTEGISPAYSSAIRLGVKYFLTESVAFGPALQFDRQWPRNSNDSKNDISLIGQFSIHL